VKGIGEIDEVDEEKGEGGLWIFEGWRWGQGNGEDIEENGEWGLVGVGENDEKVRENGEEEG
uniref:hypothetical protein n=1 Tax=Neisseria sicca TaxID=490 RepID=UPI001C99A38D